MISPHPVYSPRGTPISVFNRCLALCALGHQVDLVTYPMGEDLAVDGLRYLRVRLPGVTTVRVGPSWAKLPLNAAVATKALSLAARRRRHYDLIHSHEEAGPVGALAARMSGVPHIYDMGNDWGVVVGNYGARPNGPLARFATAAERRVVRGADVTIAHFPAIEQNLTRRDPSSAVRLVYNVAFESTPDPSAVAALRAQWSTGGRPIIVYSGTLEPYQGLPLLVEALAMAPECPAQLVIIGGRPDQIAALRRQADGLGIGDRVTFTGVLAAGLIPACLAAADLLVSPRSSGSNTPLKIFSYLRSGTPILATAIESHTQILDGHSAMLVAPSAHGLAGGLRALLGHPELAHELGAGARSTGARYSIEAYIEALAGAYQVVGGPPPDPTVVGRAAGEIARFIQGRQPDASHGAVIAPVDSPAGHRRTGSARLGREQADEEARCSQS